MKCPSDNSELDRKGCGMSNYLTIDYLKCTGCRLCEAACAWHNEHSTNPEHARIHVYSFFPGVDVVTFCAKCPDAPCVAACKFQALSIGDDGCILLDRDACIGCGQCVRKCRAKCITMHPTRKVPLICDHCGGTAPACQAVCQTKALDFMPVPFNRDHLAKTKETIRDLLLEKFV